MLSVLLTVLLCGCAVLVGILMYLKVSGNTSLAVARTIKKPVRSGNATTWDCIWFGNYWQEDTNGDGFCYDKVTKGCPADDKQPIKWRVLDVDADGNALLLADKLIDIVQYNEKNTEVTWETCTLRSYLNGYGSTQNVRNRDFSGDNSFLYNAFSETERNNIITSELTNPDNPIFGTRGGNPTQDKIFCLSLQEAMTAGYGFIKNEFTKGYCTDGDLTRKAVTTKFIENKSGYNGKTAGTSDWWWLRSPGYSSYTASFVGLLGAAYARSFNVDYTNSCLRPAFRMNLSSSSSLWSYAGTVCSDGTVIEEKPDSDPDL